VFPFSTCAPIFDQHSQVIMKDISTVRYEAQRLWEGARDKRGDRTVRVLART
jgi:hypothetical protein